jgi:pimeloyl-ACP methyl ester carboxylesterase
MLWWWKKASPIPQRVGALDLNSMREEVQPAKQTFRWNDITPSETLQYSDCFSSFLCARLSVPLNWNATYTGNSAPQAVIAVIKLPAKVSITDPRYGGPIIVNPGGPGESGVYQVLTDGLGLQTVVDSNILPEAESKVAESDAKYFDILSFDPRGVNNTTPRLRCFLDAFNQQVWQLQSPDYGLLWHSESIIGLEWGRASALGASCSADEEGDGILPYLNTPQTARDMLHIIEQEAQWREKQTITLSKSQLMHSTQPELTDGAMRESHHPSEAKIQYWGMSYGTLLGATFAAMYPDRVGRLVLDGVVDPADHYAGNWLTQLQDSDHIISQLCEYCFRAGPTKCPLYTGDSPTDIEQRFTKIMYGMKENPIAVLPVNRTTQNSIGPDMITYGDLHLRLLSGMYFPFTMAESLFTLLWEVEQRNASSAQITDLVLRKQAFLTPSGCQKEDLSDPHVPYVSGIGAFQSISCMDIGGSMNLTRNRFREYLNELQGQSHWIGPSWARNKLSCEGFTVKPAWKPDMSFQTQKWPNTSNPLLLIGNTHDTVTPLRNARRVSTLFPTSIVLQQDSQGHCSHSSPTLCTGRVIRHYFQTGELPEEGTICKPDTLPFLGCMNDEKGPIGDCNFADSSDARLWEALVELADPFKLKLESDTMSFPL